MTMRCLMIKKRREKRKGPRPLRESFARAVSLTLLIFWSREGVNQRSKGRRGGWAVGCVNVRNEEPLHAEFRGKRSWCCVAGESGAIVCGSVGPPRSLTCQEPGQCSLFGTCKCLGSLQGAHTQRACMQQPKEKKKKRREKRPGPPALPVARFLIFSAAGEHQHRDNLRIYCNHQIEVGMVFINVLMNHHPRIDILHPLFLSSKCSSP